jgi:hypothetical protein
MKLNDVQNVTRTQERAQTCTNTQEENHDLDWRVLDVKYSYVESEGAGWRAGQ